MKREAILKKIIADLQGRLDQTSPGMNNEKAQEIATLHSSVLEKVGNIQTRTAKILLEQEKDIVRHFDNKINEIKKDYDNEKAKYIEKLILSAIYNKLY